MKKYTYPAVITIAGSDSGGGAGIQADLKTLSALGCFGTSAITAITVQNTTGVSGIHSVPADFVYDQVVAVMEDIRPSVIKIGMIHSLETATVIRKLLLRYPDVPVVLDPVMVATSGDKLIHDETIRFLQHYLFPLATIITPNMDEATMLCKTVIRDAGDLLPAARLLLQCGSKAVLLKGGHLKTTRIADVYVDSQGTEQVYSSRLIRTGNVHGTGCTLASAISAYMALGETLHRAVEKARAFTYKAIRHGEDVQTGKGNGPLNHFFKPLKLHKNEME